MKTKINATRVQSVCLSARAGCAELRQSALRAPRSALGFTLIEILTVIAIMALLAAMLMPVGGIIERKSLIQHAQAERDQLETAINSYYRHYGYYPPSSGLGTPTTNQLYYELSGTSMTTNNGSPAFTTSDNRSTISTNMVASLFGVGGFMNCNKGSGDDRIIAQDFLTDLKPGQIGEETNGDGSVICVIGTAVRSDSFYTPPLPGFVSLAGGPANPWRYVYPGVNNPNSYDLWVQIYIGGKTNLICNWFDQPKANYPIP